MYYAKISRRNGKSVMLHLNMHRNTMAHTLKYQPLWTKEAKICPYINIQLTNLKKCLIKKEISAQELTDMSVKQIKAVDNDIQAFLTVTEEEALKNAKAVDEGQATGKSLAGIPVSIKDNIVTKG